MGAPDTRRGFLSGLASLPLIGGSVALIGTPSAVAVEASPHLLAEYANWLALESYRASRECYGPQEWNGTRLHGAAYRWHEAMAASSRKPEARSFPPSARAALVLSAVGCDWREGVR